MNEMRKLMETIQQLNEYFVKRGMTVGEVYNTLLGIADSTGEGSLYDELEFLRTELGFEDAAEELEKLADEAAAVKYGLKSIWNQPVKNERLIRELEERANVYLDTIHDELYDDENYYIDAVISSLEQIMEILGQEGDELVVEDEDEDLEGPYDSSAEMRERFK